MSEQQEEKIKNAYGYLEKAVKLMVEVENERMANQDDYDEEYYPTCEVKDCSVTCTTAHNLLGMQIVNICPEHLKVWQKLPKPQELRLKINRAKFEADCAKMSCGNMKVLGGPLWQFAMSKFEALEEAQKIANDFVITWITYK